MVEKENASIRLDIYSDVVCPWCYVGKARLDAALELLKGKIEVKTTWKPFELNPSMPSEGADRTEYMQKKFGTSDFTAMHNRLNTAGAQNGVVFDFESMKRVPNTFRAHRLLWFANTKNKQHELADVLFRNYFRDGLDVGETAVLIDAAKEVGLEVNDVQAFLSSDHGVEEVQAEEQEGKLKGISAVPTFVLNDEIIASGAVPPEDLVAAIESAVLAKL